MRCLPTSVRHPSVRCPSPGHISKTRQDRPIVTMYIKVGADDSVACRTQILFKTPLQYIFSFRIKITREHSRHNGLRMMPLPGLQIYLPPDPKVDLIMPLHCKPVVLTCVKTGSVVFKISCWQVCKQTNLGDVIKLIKLQLQSQWLSRGHVHFRVVG